MSAESHRPSAVLVCFAVKEEAKHFLPTAARGHILLTGMGRANAAKALAQAIEQIHPSRVITAGFAGGLNPKYPAGTVLYDEDPGCGLSQALGQAGAVPGQFYCADQVIVAASEKARIWKRVQADAVEMESMAIRSICQKAGIPSATVRVISDDATQDLPLDFNTLLTPENKISYWRLATALARRPLLIPALMKFQRQTDAAARRLGDVLTTVCSAVDA